MRSTQPLATTLRHFVAHLPILIAIWVVAAVGVSIVLSIAEGRPLGDQLVRAVPFLPMAIPVSPLLWLWRIAPTPDRTVRAAAAGFGWFIVTVPLAIWAAMALADLLGLD